MVSSLYLNGQIINTLLLIVIDINLRGHRHSLDSQKSVRRVARHYVHPAAAVGADVHSPPPDPHPPPPTSSFIRLAKSQFGSLQQSSHNLAFKWFTSVGQVDIRLVLMGWGGSK